MNFKLNISKYILRIFTEKDLNIIGISGLEEGYDSENLRILAGLSQNEHSSLARQYFEHAMIDLDIELWDKKQSVKYLTEDITNIIINNGLDPYEGVKEIEKVIGMTSYHWEDIGLMDVYCDYITIWEDWSNGKYTVQEKAELYKSIANWNKKQNNALQQKL